MVVARQRQAAVADHAQPQLGIEQVLQIPGEQPQHAPNPELSDNEQDNERRGREVHGNGHESEVRIRQQMAAPDSASSPSTDSRLSNSQRMSEHVNSESENPQQVSDQESVAEAALVTGVGNRFPVLTNREHHTRKTFSSEGATVVGSSGGTFRVSQLIGDQTGRKVTKKAVLNIQSTSNQN